MPEPDSRTILVVDDDPALRSLMEMILKEEGYRTATAENGTRALDVLSRTTPVLILLDMKMPVMDGPEFARQYHARYGHAAPIVVLSAAENAARQAAEIGAEGWLGKPFELDDLINVVREYIAH